MNLRRQLEVALVLIALGIAAWLVKARFDDILRESRRVQLRMAAESMVTNGALLQLQCPDMNDVRCLAQALGRLQRARVTRATTQEGVSLPSELEGVEARLRAIALASGVEPNPGPSGRWVVQFESPDTLQVSLAGVIECRFLLRIHLKSGSVTVEDQLLTC